MQWIQGFQRLVWTTQKGGAHILYEEIIRDQAFGIEATTALIVTTALVKVANYAFLMQLLAEQIDK